MANIIAQLLRQLETETQALISKADADYERNVTAAILNRKRAIQNAIDREDEIKWQLGLDNNTPFRGLIFTPEYPILRYEMWVENQEMLDKQSE